MEGKKQALGTKIKPFSIKNFHISEIESFKSTLKHKLIGSKKCPDVNYLADKYAKLNSFQGLLEFLFEFGNTLEILYVGGLL